MRKLLLFLCANHRHESFSLRFFLHNWLISFEFHINVVVRDIQFFLNTVYVLFFSKENLSVNFALSEF